MAQTQTAEQSFADQIVARDGSLEWTQGELARLFDRVANTENWKYPINALVTLRGDYEVEGTRVAVEFFTGSKLDELRWIRTTADGPWYRIRAAGYYRTIGA